MVNASPYERLYCVIDGLDVYRDEMHDLITKLNTIFISNDEISVRKLFCTSRPDKGVLDAWRPPRKDLHCNPKDISAFISTRVDSLGNQFNQEKRDLIKSNLASRAENTFLWIDVVIRKIKSLSFRSDNNIENTIKRSSEDLYDLYEDLVTKAVGANKENARILVWVVYAQEPLCILALRDAISFDPKDDSKDTRVKNLSNSRSPLDPGVLLKELGTLLDVVGDYVYLIHQSLKDYLENGTILSNYFKPIEPRLVPAYVCMEYLSLDEVNYLGNPQLPFNERQSYDERQLLSNKITDNYPLFSYAMHHWFKHIRSPEDVQDRRDLLDSVLGVNGYKIPNWIKVFPKLSTFYNAVIHRTPYDIALALDIPLLLELLVLRDPLAPGHISSENFLLTASDEVMTLLLEHMEAWNLRVTTYVAEHAIKDLKAEVLQVMLDKCREVKMTEEMIEMAIRRYNGEAVLHLILSKRGKEVKITEEVVEVAARSDGPAMGILLDRRGEEVKITEEVVEAAARSGGPALGILLDRRGEEVKITEEVVKAAVKSISSKPLRVLLNRRGEEVKITEEVVKAAVRSYFTGPLRILLKRRGPEVKITEEVLKDAANNHYAGVEILNFLLNLRGDNILVTDEVIESAATSGCESNLVLLEKGCHANIKSQHRSTCQLFHSAKFETLPLTKFDADIRDIYNRSLLWWSAKNGRVINVQLLLDRKVEIDVRCSLTGKTPIMLAVGGIHSDIVELLLNAGADYTLEDYNGDTALSIAKENNWSLKAREIIIIIEGCTARHRVA